MSDQEYAALAAKLRDRKGDSDAKYYLDLLERGYQDSAQRLDALKKMLRELGVPLDQGGALPPAANAALLPAAPAPTPGASVATSIEKAPAGRPKTSTGRSEHRAGGFYTVPNIVADELLAVMPGPVLKAYIYCCRIADADASFYISHQRLAERIGCRSRRHGERIMARLLDAGLVRQRVRGGPGRANDYQLAGLTGLDFEKARQFLSRPLRDRSQRPYDTGPGDRGIPVPRVA